MTLFMYRFACLNIVDSEAKTQCVLLRLGLRENVLDFRKFMSSWEENFEIKFPRVVFSDGDEEVQGAIISVPYSEDIVHLIFTFHIFNMYAKDKSSAILKTFYGPGSWNKIRSMLKNANC